MYLFLLPLLLGFSCDLASAFTGFYSRRLGDEWGTAVSLGLRGVLGLPVWALGFALAMRAPSAPLIAPSPILRLAGWALIAAGGALIGGGLITLGRRMFLPSAGDALIESGLYALVRHPMDSGAGLIFIGLFLLIPTLTVAIAAGLGLIWLTLQTRAEEVDLLGRLPAYRDYMARVPALIPRIRTNVIHRSGQ